MFLSIPAGRECLFAPAIYDRCTLAKRNPPILVECRDTICSLFEEEFINLFAQMHFECALNQIKWKAVEYKVTLQNLISAGSCFSS
jgi:hypothetical protein